MAQSLDATLYALFGNCDNVGKIKENSLNLQI